MQRTARLLVLILLLVAATGCRSLTDAAAGSGRSSQPLVNVSPVERTHGEVPYVDAMLEAFAQALRDEDLEEALEYFAEDCEARVLGDTTLSPRETTFWQSYLATIINLYVDVDIEVYEVELDGRGNWGHTSFRLLVDGARAVDDFSRKIFAEVVYDGDRWRFIKFVEVGN